MSRITLAFILSMLLAQATQAANVRMCTDKNGHKTFTQGACPKNTSRKVIEVQPAQSPVTALSSKELQMLNNAKNKSRRKSTSQTKSKKKKTTIIRRRCSKYR